LDRLLPNVNVVPSRFWFPSGLPCLQVDPMAARKKGDLVPYCGDVFPTEARKAPSCPLVKRKMDLYCSWFSLSETSQHRSSSWLVRPSISSSYHTRHSACSKIGPCGCAGSSNLLVANSTISSIRCICSPFYRRRATYHFAAGACCSTK